jgi:hypothetical protein
MRLRKTGIPNIADPATYDFAYTAGISLNTASTTYNYYVGNSLTSGVYNVKIYPFASGGSNGSGYLDHPTGKYVNIAYGTPLAPTYTVNIP